MTRALQGRRNVCILVIWCKGRFNNETLPPESWKIMSKHLDAVKRVIRFAGDP